MGTENNVLAIASDVTKLEDERNAVQQVIDKWGALDVVVVNAGVGHFAPIDQISDEHWHQMIDINLNGVFHTLKASVEALKRSKGYYITLASLAGTNFFVNGAGYNAGKFGVVGFTQAAILDLRPYDIKVSTIMPGSVATHFNGHIPSAEDTCKSKWNIGRSGRRPLLIYGMAAVSISLLMIGTMFSVSGVDGLWIVVMLCVYMASLSFSINAVIWVLLREIYPIRIRGRAMSIVTSANWGTNFGTAFLFPWFVAQIGMGAGFFVFAVFCLVATIFFYKVIPETKGKSLEKIEINWELKRE